MPRSQPQKTTLKRRRSAAVSVLLAGLGQIAADLHSYGTLPDKPSKPWPDVSLTLPVHHPASQVHVNC